MVVRVDAYVPKSAATSVKVGGITALLLVNSPNDPLDEVANT